MIRIWTDYELHTVQYDYSNASNLDSMCYGQHWPPFRNQPHSILYELVEVARAGATVVEDQGVEAVDLGRTEASHFSQAQVEGAAQLACFTIPDA